MEKRKYVIAGPWDKGRCVAMVTYGNKYIIAKCKEAHSSLKRIENGLNAFVNGGKNNEDGLYYFFNLYVKKYPNKQMSVTILLETDDTLELLKREQLELDKGRSTKKFLNNQVEAYIPMYDDETKMHGWIPPHAVLNFKNWLKASRQEREALWLPKKKSAKKTAE
jgi:hypothetical protein